MNQEPVRDSPMTKPSFPSEKFVKEMAAMARKHPALGRGLETFCRFLQEIRTRHVFVALAEHAEKAPDIFFEQLERMIKNATSAGDPAGWPLHFVPDVYGRSAHLLHDIREDEAFTSQAREAVESKNSQLYYDRLFTLYEAMRSVSQRFQNESLNAIEVGVYRGGTSHYICSVLQKLHGNLSRFYCVDTFEGHSVQDLPEGNEGSHSPSMFSDTSFERVKASLGEFPFAEVLKARIQDVTEKMADRTFHFIHLDVDIFEPTLFALDFFIPRLAVGGIVCVDDYNKKTCPGVRSAIERVMLEKPGELMGFNTQTAQFLAVKLPPISGNKS